MGSGIFPDFSISFICYCSYVFYETENYVLGYLFNFDRNRDCDSQFLDHDQLRQICFLFDLGVG